MKKQYYNPDYVYIVLDDVNVMNASPEDDGFDKDLSWQNVPSNPI